MSTFDEQIKRMQALYTYGKVNEGNNHSNYSLEYHATGADGKEYGIIRECHKFYIKSCPASKAQIAEAYNYIGGEANKSDYVYESYDSARKNFDLKMKSINEAQGKKIVTEALDPFKIKGVEAGTDAMMNEIARMRQIMHNTACLMNESSAFGSTPFTSQPEAAHGHSGDKDTPFTENGEKFDEQDELKTGGKPEDKGTPFGDGGKTPEGEAISVDGSVASMNPKGGKVARVDEGEEKVCPVCGKEECVCEDEEPAEDVEDVESDEEPVEDAPVEDFEGEEEPVEDVDDMEEDEDDFDFSDIDFEDDEEGAEEEPVDMDAEAEEPVEDEGESEIDELRAEIESLKQELAALKGEDAEVEDGGDVDFELETEDEPIDDGMAEEEPVEDEEDDYMLSEAKANQLRPLIKMIAESIINEDELHVFGQHPGYRKKPMTLPPTGEDKNEHGEDINDDSVHNETPFGTSIGDGMPFNEPVSAEMKNSIAEAIAARILGKKKVN